ncbi:nuclear transport factor 2 family protein [Microtetraspora sp. NBRC 13810]|uniref:nuclear transport factor 2 family protein n=1 Tax=Microtetraspora sp. NBRC 13810 TaxID=3030990 RepID=UPI0025534EC5|nr:nuclear transport factor 2 family protein [Microtetraspora sp. NBRC 13810]
MLGGFIVAAGAVAIPVAPASAGTLGEAAITRESSGKCSETDRRIVRQAFDAWRKGTGSVTDVFAPDIVWRIEGRSLISKVYRGKQQFMNEVMLPFVARFDKSPYPFRPSINAVLCEGDTVIVYWDGRGIANDGRPYENSYAWFMKMRNGKVVYGTAFYDSIAFNDLWTRVRPSR